MGELIDGLLAHSRSAGIQLHGIQFCDPATVDTERELMRVEFRLGGAYHVRVVNEFEFRMRLDLMEYIVHDALCALKRLYCERRGRKIDR